MGKTVSEFVASVSVTLARIPIFVIAASGIGHSGLSVSRTAVPGKVLSGYAVDTVSGLGVPGY